MKPWTKRIRWLAGICIAIDLLVLVLFWTPSLIGFALSGFMGKLQALVAKVASPLLVPILIVLFVVLSIRDETNKPDEPQE